MRDLSDLVWGALAGMLILEGILPLLNPRGWRQVFARVLELTDGQIRFIGLLSVGVGVALLALWY
jgi:uncharacterized protein YjeT (DUF2065 family)